MDQPPFKNSMDRKKWIKVAVMAGGILVVALAVIVILVAINKPKAPDNNNAKVPGGPSEFVMSSAGTPINYAGSPQYDACGLVSFDTIRGTVKDYQTLLDMNGTDKKPSDPLTIEHNYVDRDIAAPLGKDGESRPAGTTIGGNGQKDASSFVSTNDSNCWYGQGKDLSLGLGSVFAKVFVTQKPTPISGEFTAYLGTLKKAASQDGIDAYVEPQTDSSGFFTGIVTNMARGVVVVFKASSQELGQKGTTEIANALSQAPKGPVNMKYPKGWVAMPNPCRLLTAEDFEQATGKPASALAEDTMGLNEIGGRLMQRTCERLEVERLDGSPISKSVVTARVADTVENAKKYMEDLKTDNTSKFMPLRQKLDGVDEAYVRESGENAYEINLRRGNVFIAMDISKEGTKDTSADVYAERLLPSVRAAIDRL